MASASGFSTPPPPDWSGVRTLVQNWLQSKSPQFKAQQEQIAKENQFRQNAQDLAQKQYEDTHAQSLLSQQATSNQLKAYQQQYTLMHHDPSPDLAGDESTPTGNDVGKEMGPTSPQSGATVDDSQPTTMKTSEPSSQKSTTLAPAPAYDPNEFLSNQIFKPSNGPKFDPNKSLTEQVASGFPAEPSEPAFSSTAPTSRLGKPMRQIPSLKGDQKASNSQPDVPSSAAPGPDTASGGAKPRGQEPQATTASSAAAGADATPSSAAMQFGIHGKPQTANAVRGASGEAAEPQDASTPWEQLSPRQQKRVIAGYQREEPSIAPADAVRAYRMQQWARSNISTPSNMIPSEMTIDPQTGIPTVKYVANPFGDGNGGGMATPAGLEMAGKIDTLNKSISGDEQMKNAQTVVRAFGNMLQQAEAAKTSKTPGVNDQLLAQLYQQTFLPNTKFDEKHMELVGDTHNLLDSLKKPLLHALSGQTLLPEHREALLESARMNAQSASSAATQSTAAPRALGERVLGDHQRALQFLTQVPTVPGRKEATGTSPRVGNGTVEGSSDNQAGLAGYKTVSSMAEAQKLPKGTKFIYGPTGQRGTKN
jgi:hypothetical protein